MKMKRVFRVTLSVLLMVPLSMFAFAQQNLPEGAIARLAEEPMRDIAYSPDGGLLAMASASGIWLYAIRPRGRASRDTPVRSIIFPLARMVRRATASGRRVLLWDVATHTLDIPLCRALCPLVRMVRPWQQWTPGFSVAGLWGCDGYLFGYIFPNHVQMGRRWQFRRPMKARDECCTGSPLHN